ncbi:Farnesyl diphosphate synthase,geranyltranstransferase,Geranylgeranyl pyrophosphate synthase,solanesyl diphosphate synthase,Polyprenyl synthetase [Chlamydia serpentis]|uniref:Farnesyl diphosphate synthase,geranyltranstransferase,Geranylgeranyl pyrophosphate synthase,solanesyl diphosphate synthase,Polyprenyl synthetase n=1 Tax=Chlamydia serpentis TaxID=1967782 RepID=A0A2R8FBU1_9CHLA|nr:Farnesyl diphosphate synthase,geranyltranstransferase,Geranylgeranyl pyrophosphate synthase,solanesyl diphosphate synthase,Polyprenyl synthetase [Chlamydia serpentis]
MIHILDTYRPNIEIAIENALEEFGPVGHPIRSPVEYALKGGGKRIRPSLVCMIAQGLGLNYEVMDSALAVEFVHTSTLIADDLPCMDNDDERRGRPTVHKAFDEATALLASYALIPAAYSHLRLNAKKLKEKGCDPKDVDVAYDIIGDITDKNIGFSGVLGGQYDDMFFANKGKEHVQSIMIKKTGALFEIACISGWLFGGGDPSFTPLITSFSNNFGLLFQIKDDLLDIQRDYQKIGLNYALLFGENAALELLETSKNNCLELLDRLTGSGLKTNSELEIIISSLGSF